MTAQSVKEWSDVLIGEVEKLGFPREFGALLAASLGTESTIRRLALYVAHNQPGSAEDIADEMLAIRDDRDHWQEKKQAEYYNRKVTEWQNRKREPEGEGEDG